MYSLKYKTGAELTFGEYTYSDYLKLRRFYGHPVSLDLTEDRFYAILEEMDNLEQDYTEGGMYKWHDLYISSARNRLNEYLELKKVMG